MQKDVVPCLLDGDYCKLIVFLLLCLGYLGRNFLGHFHFQMAAVMLTEVWMPELNLIFL